MLRDRLTNDFSEVLKNFQVIQRTAAQKEKESVIRARAASRHSDEDGSSGTLIDLHGSSAAMKSSGQLQQQTQIQMEEEVDLEELREREKSIRKIESDIVDVNQIFKDLATMIHAQGEVIDSIESNVESATIQVQEGATQIAKARDYQVSRFLLLTTFLSCLVSFVPVPACLLTARYIFSLFHFGDFGKSTVHKFDTQIANLDESTKEDGLPHFHFGTRDHCHCIDHCLLFQVMKPH